MRGTSVCETGRRGLTPALGRRQRRPAPARHTTPPPPGRGRPRLGQSGRPRTPRTTPSARIRLRPRPHRRSPIRRREDMPSSRRRPRCIAGRPRAFRDAPVAGTASRRQERSHTRRRGPRRGAASDRAMLAARLPQPPSGDRIILKRRLSCTGRHSCRPCLCPNRQVGRQGPDHPSTLRATRSVPWGIGCAGLCVRR